MPPWFQHACTFAVLAIELGVPFLFFVARRPRMLAAWIILVFELGILLTGNYNFFNLLAMSLCVLLFDDQALRGILPSRYRTWIATLPPCRHVFFERVVLGSLVALILFLSVSVMFLQLGRRPLPHPVTAALEWFAPLAIVNSYGLFANMTTTRPEIVIEGSQDGVRPGANMPSDTNRETPTAGHRGTSHTSRGWIGRCGLPRSLPRMKLHGLPICSYVCYKTRLW